MNSRMSYAEAYVAAAAPFEIIRGSADAAHGHAPETGVAGNPSRAPKRRRRGAGRPHAESARPTRREWRRMALDILG